MLTLEEFEKRDLANLKELLKKPEFEGIHIGPNRLMRYLKIGYSRASNLIDAALARNILKCDKDENWRINEVKITKV